jgi:hypothetical protein
LWDFPYGQHRLSNRFALTLQRSGKLSADQPIRVPIQDLLPVPFEIYKHDAVSEAGVPGDDQSTDNDRLAIEPKGSSKSFPDR